MSILDKLSTLIPLEQIEQGAQQQMYDALKLDFLIKLAIMPDVHQGYSLPIGGVALLDKVISPPYVGYDIDCGIFCVMTEIPFLDIIKNQRMRDKIFDEIYKVIPCGVGLSRGGGLVGFQDFKSASGDKQLTKEVTEKLNQLGTLGSGNHFVEIGMNRKGNLCATVHSGSRKPGWLIAQYYMRISKLVDKDLPKGFLHLHGDVGQQYVQDLIFARKFAEMSRKVMIMDVLKVIGIKMSEVLRLSTYQAIHENHNTVEIQGDKVLHRKGATPAEKGVLGVVPGSMQTGIYITKGLGNDEYLNSASHGAGRKMSRSKAKSTISLEKAKKQMTGITCKMDKSTLEEAPDAYKDLHKVIEAQEGIVIDVVDFIRPIINVKG